MATDVLVIGEALIDAVDDGDAARETVGGSPANVAVGVARLGHRAHLLTRIGRDERGARIAEHLASAGVGVLADSWTDTATSTAYARLQADGSAAYEFDIAWDVPSAEVADAALVHAGSLGLFLQPGGARVLESLERAAHAGARVTVDPNIRPAVVGAHDGAFETFARAARVADVVKLSDEDAAWLYPGLSPQEALADISARGPQLVVLTRGSQGAMALGTDGIVEVAPWRVDVADTIGAGDAYMASLIASVLEDAAVLEAEVALERALRRAAVAAGMTVARPGADPPTRGALDAIA